MNPLWRRVVDFPLVAMLIAVGLFILLRLGHRPGAGSGSAASVDGEDVVAQSR